MFRKFFVGVPRILFDSFRGYNLLSHVLAIALTAVLVLSGFDWWFFEATRKDIFYWTIMVAGIGGFLVPIAVPVLLYVYGEIRHDARARGAGIVVAQAAIVAWLVSSAYKVFTGRMQPEFLTHFSIIDTSRDFHFGFLQHGIFWGWPSSHACVAFAVATTFFLLYRSRSIRSIALGWAFLVAFGAAIGFHWFSDTLAGAIIGIMIGNVATRRFMREENVVG